MKKITIIGAGLGGLTAGALLAQKGYKVTILEQHNIVGGCATTFKRKGGFICEVGLHEMDSLFSDHNKKKIFETLDVYDNIEFVKTDEFFRVVGQDMDFIMPEGKQNAILALCEAYPSEERGIKKYFTLIQSISKEFTKLSQSSWWQYVMFPFVFPNILRYRTVSVKTVLDKWIEDEKLKLILNANVAYYHDTIKMFSFLYHAVAQHGYYEGGGWYIKGGSQKLSDYLASFIREHGGEIICKAEVTQINPKSTIYRYKKEEITLSHDTVISNLAPSTTYALANIVYKENKSVASSLLTIYIGFKSNLKSIYGKKAYSTFFMNDIASMNAYDVKMEKPIEKRSMMFVDYSQINAALTDDSKSFGVICTTDYLKDWESLSKEEYAQKKTALIEQYLVVVEKEYPNIREYIAFAEVATAKTMKRYLKTPQGTAYGFAPTNKQFFRIPEVKSKKLDNLYFVGAWVIGGGFTPAILSGGMCASKILKES